MITLDAAAAGRALGLGSLATPVTGVSTDSRTLRPGDLFVALRGERFDGHDYVQTALQVGACGAVVENAVWAAHARSGAEGACGGGGGGGPVYPVPDTLAALGALAREVRRRSHAKVFAITGSVGKTSTKDLLKAMLGRVCRVVATSHNQNNEVGVPLTLLSIEDDTDAVVVEMGMRGLGQIAQLAAVAEPDVGVITNVHPVHLELLGTLDNVARAKAELVSGVLAGGVGVIPADCEALSPHLAEGGRRLVRFATSPAASAPDQAERRGCDADVRGWLVLSGDEYDWLLAWPGGETRVGVGHMARHALENAVAAAAACYAGGMPVAECAAGIADLELSRGRGQVLEVGGICVIDDSYNANPAAVKAALGHLMELAVRRGGRAVAVLGDMLELGPEEERYHAETGALAAEAGVSILWGVGPLSRAMVRGFSHWWRTRGDARGEWQATHLESADEAGKVVAGLKAGDVVLVKASRGTRLEKVVIRVVDEANAGRWGGGAAQVGDCVHTTGENRLC